MTPTRVSIAAAGPCPSEAKLEQDVKRYAPGA
jgi:hypothetical protein